MKISRIETIPVQVPINPERAIRGGRGGHTVSPFLLVRIHTDEGIVGLGEVSCTPIWSGEDQFTSAHFIEHILAPLLTGQDPTQIERLTAAVNAAVANNPFTKAGIEMALWDILGKVAGLPLYRLLGGRCATVCGPNSLCPGWPPLRQLKSRSGRSSRASTP